MSKIYDLRNVYYNHLKLKLKAPKFQRNFIWKLKAKKSLIATLKKDLPIGCIILQEMDDGFFNIIDGRQRLSTLADFEKNRAQYFDPSDISHDEIDRLFTSIPEIETIYRNLDDSKIKSIYASFPKTVQTLLKKNGYSKVVVCEKLRDYMLGPDIIPPDKLDALNAKKRELKKFEDNKYKLLKALENFYDNFCSIVNLDELVLPCIIFERNAQPNDIIESFENINTKGTKLSKYDLYAASWESKIICVDDNDILEKVIAKYNDTIENNQNIETDGFSEAEIRSKKEINIFEYSYAISKIIGDHCGHMYETKDSSEVDSLGFTILAGIFNVKTDGDMVSLADKLVDSKLDYRDLKDKIVSCAEGIRDVLVEYCVPYKGANFYDHSINQLVSYIVTEFKCLYTLDLTHSRILNNPKANKIKIFHRYLPKYYLCDKIDNYWGSTGDKKLDSIVCTEDKEGNAIDITENRYFKDISKVYFEQLLTKWITDPSDGTNVDTNDNAKPLSKLFISFLICKNGGRVTDGKLDVEHIITQGALGKAAESTGAQIVRISSPANLTLLPLVDNRGKGELTYYQWADIQKGNNSAKVLSPEILKKYLYPERDDIRFVECGDLNVDTFNAFKDKRGRELVNKFLELFYED